MTQRNSRMSLFVERQHAITRHHARQMALLQAELLDRIHRIEQAQSDLIRIYFNHATVYTDFLERTSLRKKHLKMDNYSFAKLSVKDIEKDAIKNTDLLLKNGEVLPASLHFQEAEGHSVSETRAAFLRRGLSYSSLHPSGSLGTGSHQQPPKAPLRKALTHVVFKQKLPLHARGHHESPERDVVSLQEKQPFSGGRTSVSNLTKPTTNKHLSENEGSNLTAFAFSRYREQSLPTGRHRQTAGHLKFGEEKGTEGSLKSKIRNRVVKNYLLMDVFKRLNATKTNLPRHRAGVARRQQQHSKDEFSADVMEDLRKCRYLRLSQTQSLGWEKEAESEITKIDIH